MTTQELINKCNELYDFAIVAMEQGKDVSAVHDVFLDVAKLLAYIAKVDPVQRTKYLEKAKTVYAYATEMAEKSSYADVYFKIKGVRLPEEEPVDLDLPSLSELDTEPKEEPAKEEEKPILPSVDGTIAPSDYIFQWDKMPSVSFEDVAGLRDVKEEVRNKVLRPLQHPDLSDGYDNQNGGGLLLYGPPGTGKTMIAAAIAHEIGAKFCTVGPSDILSTGVGNSERKIAALFKEAATFSCAVIFFDEFEALCPATTRSQISRQIRSEFLRQMQGVEDYSGKTDKILYLIAASNKPWEIDSAFLRPGRLGTRVYVDLPDAEARKYIFEHKLDKIREKKVVQVADDIDIDKIVACTEGFNGADIANVLQVVQEISMNNYIADAEGVKKITQADFDLALTKVACSVQKADLEKLDAWTKENNHK